MANLFSFHGIGDGKPFFVCTPSPTYGGAELSSGTGTGRALVGEVLPASGVSVLPVPPMSMDCHHHMSSEKK